MSYALLKVLTSKHLLCITFSPLLVPTYSLSVIFTVGFLCTPPPSPQSTFLVDFIWFMAQVTTEWSVVLIIWLKDLLIESKLCSHRVSLFTNTVVSGFQFCSNELTVTKGRGSKRNLCPSSKLIIKWTGVYRNGYSDHTYIWSASLPTF